MGNINSTEQLNAYLAELNKPKQVQPTAVNVDNYLSSVSGAVDGYPSQTFIIGQSGNSGALPDPAAGCSKSFTTTYRCGKGAEKNINVAAEARGNSMLFDCTTESAKCMGFKLTLTDDGNITLTDNTGKTTWTSNTNNVGIALDKYKATNGKYKRNYLQQGEHLKLGQFMGSPSGNCYLMMTDKGLKLQYEVPSCTGTEADESAFKMYSIPRQNIKNIGKIGYLAEDGVLHEYSQPSDMVLPGDSFENIGKFNSLGNDLLMTAEKDVNSCQAKCKTLPNCGGVVYSNKKDDVKKDNFMTYNSGGSTNGSYDWIVPKGVTKATFTVIGSRGQDTPYGSGYTGAKVMATISVSENQVYKICVASKGSSSGPGKCGNLTDGYGGGTGNTSNSYGNGGAASIVYLSNPLSPLIVAGGGGGGGFQADGGPAGVNSDGSGSVGKGQGGAGGVGGSIPSNLSQTNGSNSTSNTSGGGGGGGGGIYGGGGGGRRGGGGGGGSYVTSDASNVSYTSDTATIPLVTIAWISIGGALRTSTKLTSLGGYEDSSDRRIPRYMGKVESAEKCAEIAKANNKTVFGLQYYGECWIGDDLTRATSYGKKTCDNSLGSTWCNNVYTLETTTTPEPNCFIKDEKIYPVSLRQRDDNYELYVRNKKLNNNNSCNKEIREINTQKWELLPMGEKMSMQTLCSLGAATESEHASLRVKRAELDNMADQIKTKVQNLRSTDKVLLKNLNSNVKTMHKTLDGYSHVYQQNDEISSNYSGLVEDSNLNMTSEMYKNITYSIIAVVVVIGATQIYRSTQRD